MADKAEPCYVDDTEHAPGKLFPDGEHRHYAHTAAVAQKGLDGLGAAKAYAYIQLGKLYAVTFEPCPYDFKGARTLLAQDKRKAAQVVRGKLFRQRLVTGCLDYRYKFVFKKRLVLQACAWVTPSTMPKSISWFSRAFSMSRELPLASDTSIFGYLSVNSARI